MLYACNSSTTLSKPSPQNKCRKTNLFTLNENTSANSLSLEEETEQEEILYIHEKKYKKIANKLRVSSRTYFKHRNLIKKVKKRCNH